MPEARRVQFRGIDLARPVNRLRAGWVSFAQNIRALLRGAFGLRARLTDAIYTLSAAVRSIERLNDTTPPGPVSGFAIISVDADGNLYCNATKIAVGLSGNPVSMIPFRPNTSVQPWMYIGDSAADGDVTITTEFAIDGTPTTFVCSGMVKVRSDVLVYKTGIKEPQLAPTVSTAGTTTTGTDALPATTIPWTNVGGLNSTYNYGHSSAGDGTSPVIISTPAGAQTLTLVVTGTATVNGVVHAPGDVGPATSTFPANFTGAGPTIVLGAFTDGSGNVLTGTSPVPLLANVGAGITLQVPAGALAFQVGIDSSANTFSANSGSFSIAWTLVTSAIATKVSTLGQVTAYYWGDSPHSGPIAQYIWKNPNDSGSGIARSTSTAAGSSTNNSWQFHSTPADGSVPILWDTLDSSGSIVGAIPVFASPLESQGFQDFNMCVVGTLFFPAPGTYAITVEWKDDILLGFSAGAIADVGSGSGWASGPGVLGDQAQTITVVNSLPLQFVGTLGKTTGSSGVQTNTFNLTVAAGGSYQVEVDYDYWDKAGRQLNLTVNGAVIPPLPSGVRTNTVYWAKYRSSPTGAVSNPGPGSDPQVTPVLDNTISCPYSPDPQVDKVDYYRQDSGLTIPTYVATGPNTNPPTAITDSLSDTDAAANPTMNRDDFEPFPSIDLPKSGVVNVSGGVISWVSGDTFNIRWLAGTIIEIGSPTQLAYSLIARPTSTTSMAIPGVPDGTNLDYDISEPILAAQPLAYQFGPTDNINFTFAVGDSLRPGTLYWCKGSNLDSAPDTNQQDVTDPSEPLVNGAMSGGLGALFSIKRMWIILPNFFNALATSTGTSGSTWTLQATSISRGLYIARCLAVEGGGRIFFRVQDGIHMSPSGNGSKSITDDELYPIFEHEGVLPVAIERNGITIFPPDDSDPDEQQFRVVAQYLYWDYPYDFLGPVVGSATKVPSSVVSSGTGVPWSQPSEATDTRTPAVANITSYSITSNVVTFQAVNNYATNDLVALALPALTFLDGLTLPVASATGTSFTVDFTWANASSTAVTGTATPVPNNFASTWLPDAPFTPNTGEFVAWSLPTANSGPSTRSLSFLGTNVGEAGVAWNGGGVVSANGGSPIFWGTIGISWSGFQVPTLPAGAVITRIFPVLLADTDVSPTGTLILEGSSTPASFSGGLSGSFSGQINPPFVSDSLGSTSGAITGASVGLTIDNDVLANYNVSAAVSAVALAVYYTVASGAPSPGQTQQLAATNSGFTTPGGSTITGVAVNLNEGAVTGSGTVTAQLTLNGTPAGTPKTISAPSWPTAVPLGGNGDDWDATLNSTNVNGSTGLGVTLSAALNSSTQVNANALSITVYYTSEVSQEGNATLVFDIEAGGWILDATTPVALCHSPNDGQGQQGVLVGCEDFTIRSLSSSGTEAVTGTMLTGAIGGEGFRHCAGFTIEYESNATITLTPVVADSGNGSYAPQPVTLPSTGGGTAKFRSWFSPNKWKLMQFQMAFSDPSALVFIQGFEVDCRDWGAGGEYIQASPFGEEGGFGGQR